MTGLEIAVIAGLGGLFVGFVVGSVLMYHLLRSPNLNQPFLADLIDCMDTTQGGRRLFGPEYWDAVALCMAKKKQGRTK